MFFQLKLQTFLIKVGFHKAEIHKMARWHLVYHLLGPGGKKIKNDPWFLAEIGIIDIESSTSTSTKMKTVSEQCVRVVIMIVSDQNNFREMSTNRPLSSFAGFVIRCGWKVMITKFGNLSEFDEWRNVQTSEVTLNCRVHCFWIYELCSPLLST